MEKSKPHCGSATIQHCINEEHQVTDTTHFSEWLKRFQETDPVKNALKELNRHFPPGKEGEQSRLYAPLRDLVLSSCYGAAMFDPKNDPDEKKRLAITKALEQIDSQRMAITKLRRFITKCRFLSTMALAGTMIDLKAAKIKIISTDRDTVRDLVDILDLMLESFSARLVQSRPFVRGDRVLSRFVHGCLVYDFPLYDGRGQFLPKAKTMLLFDLVQLFRLRSLRITTRQRGQPMPAKGEPHYALAAAFVNATFKESEMDAEGARSRLRDLKRKRKTIRNKRNRAGYYPWPALRD